MRALRLQQASLQQSPHVTPPIGNHQHVDIVLGYPVDDPVGLEENFTVLPNSNIQQFLRVTSALGMFGKAAERFFDPLRHMIGTTRRIVPINVIVDLLQVACRTRAFEQNGRTMRTPGRISSGSMTSVTR